MADYVVGDLQGCYNEFITLLELVDFNPSQDHLYLVGDIVARGPDSLSCLDYLYQLQGSVSITLGNHDLHLIATYLSHKIPNPNDKLQDLFASEKLPEYINFLRQQPLTIWLENYNTLISHAGLNPQLNLQQALNFAHQAQAYYQSKDASYFLAKMYGNNINCLSQATDELTQFTFTINAFSRMRFVDGNGKMDYKLKGAANQATDGLLPWFNHKPQNHQNINICFGHWAALEGETPYQNLFALDTGCVWGKQMTLLELKTQKMHFCNNFKEQQTNS